MNSKMKGTALVAHGGGPTHVINASLAGIVEECRRHSAIGALYGARHGIAGVLAEDFIDLFAQNPRRITAIGRTPGSALGSCRQEVSRDDYERIVAVCRARNIRYFFYTGGNGSMHTALHISRIAREQRYEMRVIGVPKTIDNDLAETDHSPGYASAALFAACAIRDIGEDNRSLPTPVTVVEIMGRNAGWITAATVFARHTADDAPHLVYLPERRLPEDRLFADVEAVYRRLGRVVVAVCEGQTDQRGIPFGDLGPPDGFQRRLSGNVAHTLATLITSRAGLRARSERPGLLGRSCSAFTSAVDRDEALLCGRAAVQAALAGETEKMVTLIREPAGTYRIRTGLTELETVANTERLFPANWIAPEGNDVLPAFRDYAAPLIGPVDFYPRLDEQMAALPQ